MTVRLVATTPTFHSTRPEFIAQTGIKPPFTTQLARHASGRWANSVGRRSKNKTVTSCDVRLPVPMVRSVSPHNRTRTGNRSTGWGFQRSAGVDAGMIRTCVWPRSRAGASPPCHERSDPPTKGVSQNCHSIGPNPSIRTRILSG